MRSVPLGRTDFKIPPLVFGCNVFGWGADRRRSMALLDTIYDAGLTFIDTADNYSRWVTGNVGGESEEIIGHWLKSSGKRDEMLIATKVGMETASGSGLKPDYIRAAVERSLQRLGTDRIDIYFAHIDDRDVPLEQSLVTFSELVKEGKVRAIGASNYSADRLLKAQDVFRQLGSGGFQVLQPNYNLYARERYETELEPVATELGLGVINYYSLAAGFLTGKYRTAADIGVQSAARSGFVARYFDERGLAILPALDAVAERYGVGPVQVALAWLMARPSITAPIVSATRVDQIPDLLAATELTLDDEALATLNAASAY